MNRFLFLPLLLVLPAWLHGQATSSQNGDFTCYYFGYNRAAKHPCDIRTHAFSSNQQAATVIDNILKYAGMGYGRRNVHAVECQNVDNCYATRINGVQFIVYDPRFLKQVTDWTHTDWAAISIMAHELAHHLHNHTGDRLGSRPDNEKQADYFSGFALHNLGASLAEAQMAIRTLTNDQPSATHPPRRERLRAIEDGWRAAEALYPRATFRHQPPVLAERVDKSENPVDNVDKSGELSTKVPSEVASERGNMMKEIGCVSGDCGDGEGVFVHVSGEKYAGDWAAGKREGWGVHFYASGKKRYEGQFVSGKRHGKGIYYFPNGDRYVGDFRDDHLNGKGTYFYANGDRYYGEFQNDKKSGRGTYVYANGRQEVNYYRDDAKIRPAGVTEE